MRKIIFSIALLLLLAGCINMDVQEEIHDDGSSDLEIIYDFSALTAMTKGGFEDAFSLENTTDDSGDLPNESIGEDALQENDMDLPSCDQLLMNVTLLDATCEELEKGKYLIRGSRPEPAVLVKRSVPFVTYEVDLSKALAFMQGDNTSKNFPEEMKSTLKMMGASYTYHLVMPGQITDADIGAVNGNEVDINVFDIKNGLYVRSRKLNVVYDVAIMLLVVLLLVILFFSLRRKPKQVETPPPAPEVPPQLSAYINEQLAKGYAPEDLRLVLNKAGYEPGIVDAALRK